MVLVVVFVFRRRWSTCWRWRTHLWRRWRSTLLGLLWRRCALLHLLLLHLWLRSRTLLHLRRRRRALLHLWLRGCALLLHLRSGGRTLLLLHLRCLVLLVLLLWSGVRGFPDRGRPLVILRRRIAARIRLWRAVILLRCSSTRIIVCRRHTVFRRIPIRRRHGIAVGTQVAIRRRRGA